MNLCCYSGPCWCKKTLTFQHHSFCNCNIKESNQTRKRKHLKCNVKNSRWIILYPFWEREHNAQTSFSCCISSLCYVLVSHCPLMSTLFSLPLSAVPLPRRWLSASWPGISTTYQRGARPWACARVREEPVWDRECAWLRVPFPHLSSQG